MIIFTCSCQHAAVNFSQMDVYGFIPNAPGLLRKPPSANKGEVNLRYIMETLPTKHQGCVYIAVLHDLTRIYPTEVSHTLVDCACYYKLLFQGSMMPSFLVMLNCLHIKRIICSIGSQPPYYACYTLWIFKMANRPKIEVIQPICL